MAALAGLVRYGLLDDADARDREKIGEAIELALDGSARNGVVVGRQSSVAPHIPAGKNLNQFMRDLSAQALPGLAHASE